MTDRSLIAIDRYQRRLERTCGSLSHVGEHASELVARLEKQTGFIRDEARAAHFAAERARQERERLEARAAKDSRTVERRPCQG